MRSVVDRNVVMRRMTVYECETWSVTLRERHRLRVFENGVLRGLFGSKRKEVKEGWRKLCSEGQPHNLQCSRSVVGVIT
jgi:hypothetical protein